VLTKFKSALTAIKSNPIPFVVFILVLVVLGGGLVVKLSRAIRSKLPPTVAAKLPGAV
jgi:hypothetical protein